jgi:DNA replication protein DnaC
MVPDLLDHLRATFSPNASTSYDRRFDEVRTTPLLILDDLGSQSATPWAKEKLHQLINYRYNAELPTVFTLAKENVDQSQIDEQIITRMLDERICNYIIITAPAYQGKSGGRKTKSK